MKRTRQGKAPATYIPTSKMPYTPEYKETLITTEMSELEAIADYYSDSLERIRRERAAGRKTSIEVRKFRNIASAQKAYETWAKDFITEQVKIAAKHNKKDEPLHMVVATMFCELASPKRDSVGVVKVTDDEWDKVLGVTRKGGFVYEFAYSKGWYVFPDAYTASKTNIIMLTMTLVPTSKFPDGLPDLTEEERRWSRM